MFCLGSTYLSGLDINKVEYGHPAAVIKNLLRLTIN